ncbi:hypothetical protein D3C73_1250560 [compost metagenome]
MLAEFRDGGRHHVVREAFGTDDAHQPLAQASQAHDFTADALYVLLRALGVGGQQFAGRVQGHPARAAFEQQGAQFALQPRNLAADGRRRHFQLFRRHADRAAARHFQEVANGHFLQDLHVHRVSPWFALSATNNSNNAYCRNAKAPPRM